MTGKERLRGDMVRDSDRGQERLGLDPGNHIKKSELCYG